MFHAAFPSADDVVEMLPAGDIGGAWVRGWSGVDRGRKINYDLDLCSALGLLVVAGKGCLLMVEVMYVMSAGPDLQNFSP